MGLQSLTDTNPAKARAILRLDHELPITQVDNALSSLLGIIDYEINHVTKMVRVEYDPQKITLEEILKIVQK